MLGRSILGRPRKRFRGQSRNTQPHFCHSRDVRNDHVDDGRAAPGCGNLRQKRPLRKRKRKGGDEAEGRSEGSHHRRGRHLPWVSMSKPLRKWRQKKSGKGGVYGANRSMIYSTNLSLSNPLESCNRAPLILLPGFLPLTDLTGHFTFLPLTLTSHKSLPDLYTWLATYCSEISPTTSLPSFLNLGHYSTREPPFESSLRTR